MDRFDFLRAKKTTAETAKNRLQIIIAQERTSRGGPDYLLQFMDPRLVSENTIRRGFAPVEEGDDWVA